MTASLPRARDVDVPESDPRLLVVVDTEEEFDWDAPSSRSNTWVGAMRHIGRDSRSSTGLDFEADICHRLSGCVTAGRLRAALAIGKPDDAKSARTSTRG